MESQKLFNFQQQGPEAYSSKNYLGWLECHIFLHRLPYRKKILKSISTQNGFIIVLRLPTDRKNKSAFHSSQIIFTGKALKTAKFDIPQQEQSSDSTGHKDYRQGCGRDTGNLLKGKASQISLQQSKIQHFNQKYSVVCIFSKMYFSNSKKNFYEFVLARV